MCRLVTLVASGCFVGGAFSAPADPYPSTYVPTASAPVLIQDATVLTGTGVRLEHTDVLVSNGRIAAIGSNLPAQSGVTVVDAKGRTLTPGIIDIHSHLGVYPSPAVSGLDDGNEATAPVTANVWAEHSIWPVDPGFQKALEGGVTSLMILPGSANLIGGRGVVVKNVPSVTYQGMKFPGAPHGLKMACGENPKRVYGGKGQAPSTRMGNVAGYRAQWIEAQDYLREQDVYAAKLKAGGKVAEEAKPPKKDLRLETLAGVLRGDIKVQMHCYRADEMATMIDMSHEFGFHIAAFHHAVEAYKISNRLADEGVCAAMWADWWGFKMESNDGIQENIALVDAVPNGCAIVHSDSQEGIQRLNQEAAKAMARGRALGLTLAPEHAIQWITQNPARALGISGEVGTIEVGKAADLVLWNRDPFSVYALADAVYIDGVLQFDRAHPSATPRSDFLLGQPATLGDLR
jgi:imidazolonepropionase-like amidohydrolase